MQKLQRIAPKKSLSQNFLTDVNIARKIVHSLHVEAGSLVIEIGPGTGALTRHLLEHEISLVALELDTRAIEALSQTFPPDMYQNFKLVATDALKADLSAIIGQEKRAFVVGNLPYSITSDLLFHIFAHASNVQRCVLMVQKEVARRIVAQRGTKEYGILSLATQIVGKAKILFDVQPGSFFPRPSVTSSVFAIDFYPEQRTKEEIDALTKIIRAAFNQRRKKLRNALSQYAEQSFGIDLHTLELDILDKRAEELELNEYLGLFAQLQNLQEHG